MKQRETGKVYLVGAGPGDPKLITLRGLEAIQEADVIVYDRLAHPGLLSFRKAGAETIYVGKRNDHHTLKQEEINNLLVDLAQAGKTVVRLKGGDPCVFGRGGEEAEALAMHGIPFAIVPGVTSAIAVPAYAGIPVTHRDFASSLTIVTGHENPEKGESSLDWSKLATASGTLVLLMGVTNLESICRQLIKHGRSADTPVAAIRWGTRAEQRTVTGTLETIASRVREAKLGSPAVIIVGEVVNLREKLRWFESKPLFGKRVLVTRARAQASELAERIDELGGEPLTFPVIRLQWPSSKAALDKLDQALRRLGEYDWVFFTSPNGVTFFFDRLKHLGIDIRTMAKARVAAVGPKTAELLADRGLVAEPLPARFDGEGLLEAVKPKLRPGEKVLLARGDLARRQLPAGLAELGLQVDEVDVYENVAETETGTEVANMLAEGGIHVTTFTSSSTVTRLLEALRFAGMEDPVTALNETDIVCIGPQTAETATKAGLKIRSVAKEATIPALVETLVELYGTHKE